MPDTLANIKMPTNTWVDLYAESGIPVGTALVVEDVGSAPVRLTVRATMPPQDYDAYNIVDRSNGVRLRNTQGDSGAWGICPQQDGKINIRIL